MTHKNVDNRHVIHEKKNNKKKWQIVESMKRIEKGSLIVNNVVIEVSDYTKNKKNYQGIK